MWGRSDLAGGNVRATWAWLTASEASKQMKVRLSMFPIFDLFLVSVLFIVEPVLNSSNPSFRSHDV